MFRRTRRELTEAAATTTRWIAAEPESVFAAIDDERYFWLLRPGVTEHEIIRFHPNGGHDCRQLMAINTRPEWIHSVCVVHDPPHRAVSDCTYVLGQSRESVEVKSLNGGSEVTISTKIVFADTVERFTRRATALGLRSALDTFLARLDKVVTSPPHEP